MLKNIILTFQSTITVDGIRFDLDNYEDRAADYTSDQYPLLNLRFEYTTVGNVIRNKTVLTLPFGTVGRTLDLKHVDVTGNIDNLVLSCTHDEVELPKRRAISPSRISCIVRKNATADGSSALIIT